MAASPEPTVGTRVVGGVGQVLLSRPGSRNAITVRLGQELEVALRGLARSVRVMVIRGAGGHFCAGGDFTELEALRAQGVAAMAPLFDNFARACAVIAELHVPVIAAVEGYAMAGGFELMQACDIVLVSETAVIADNHSNFGQVPGGGSTQRLPRLVGRQRALAHILSGERLSGAEAVAWGLAYRCLPSGEFDAGVDAFARALAAKEPAALARAKRLIHDGLGLPLEEGLAVERRAVLEHLTGVEAGQGIESFTGRH